MIFFNKKKYLVVLLITAVIVAVGLGLYFGLRPREKHHQAAVVANGHECAQIGSDILQKGGTVADAAIATLFCEGVSCPQSMGLGGGFVLTMYQKSTGKAQALLARETAPKAAKEDMFVNETAVKGPKAIAVPGELKGYWELHEKYGHLPWESLIRPTIDLCRKGHVVTGYLSRILKRSENLIQSTESLKEIFINPDTNRVWVEGDIIKRLKLAVTLETIAVEGVNAIYSRNGTIAQKLIKEIQDMGGILTIEDLIEYKVRWQEPQTSHIINNQVLYTTPLPSSGILVSFMLNILNGFLPDKSLNTYQRITETFKYAYAKRSDLGDAEFLPDIWPLLKNITDLAYAHSIRSEINDDHTYNDYKHYGASFTLEEDHGTAHVNILAPNGDAIAVTSTINNIFGSKIRSESTGIILNDEMDDFSTPGHVNSYNVPASPSNFIVPGKMPLSSMTPIIIVDGSGDVKMLIGGSGGIKITSSVTYAIVHHLYLNESLFDSIEARRIHHQLIPMRIEYEKGFDSMLISGLAGKDHEMYESQPDSGFAALTAISREGNKIHAVFDSRRQGSCSVY